MRLFFYLNFFCFYIVFLFFYQDKAIASSKIHILRDTEIEQLLEDYTKPLLKVSGLEAKHPKIILIGGQNLNAFTDGYKIFIEAGALLETHQPNELIGVIAHELGHMANGHTLRITTLAEPTNSITQFSTLLSLGLLSTALLTHSGSFAGAGSAVLQKGPDMAIRNILAYQRNEERAADRSALSYLNATQQSPLGLLEVLKKFHREHVLANGDNKFADPDLLSHPLPNERLKMLENEILHAPFYNKKDSAELIERHQLAQAKLTGIFYKNKNEIYRFFNKKNNNLALQYGLATFDVKTGNPAAITKIKFLINKQPKNPFFYELAANFAFKNKNLTQAKENYKKAIAYLERPSALFYFNYARVLVQDALNHKNQNFNAAVYFLKKALLLEPKETIYYDMLTMIYTKQKQFALANLSKADSAYYKNDLKSAYHFAAQALAKLKPGSANYIRAQDIVHAIETKL